MRILILTHPRSGGFSLLAWISRELGHIAYHEPFLNPGDAVTHQKVLTGVDLAVKEDISHLIERGVDLPAFILSFDRVVFHIRKDLRSTAISRVKQLESGESHVPYEIDAQWLSEHADRISEQEEELREIQESILEYRRNQDLVTSYEGVYDTGEDIPPITEHLGISDPQWLDIIHPKRRLQGGDQSLPPASKKIRLL
jgi:hypothetical protein